MTRVAFSNTQISIAPIRILIFNGQNISGYFKTSDSLLLIIYDSYYQTDESDNDTEPLGPQPNPSRPLWDFGESSNSDAGGPDVETDGQPDGESRNSDAGGSDTEVESQNDGIS